MRGGEIRLARLKRGWGLRELARRSGVSHTTVLYWETAGELDPLSRAVQRMAVALGWQVSGHGYARARHEVSRKVSPAEIDRASLPRLTAEEARETIIETFHGARRRLLLRITGPRVTCGAKTRAGAPCRAKSEPGRARCKLHGGKSTGPKTAEGRQRIADGNRRRSAQRVAEDAISPR